MMSKKRGGPSLFITGAPAGVVNHFLLVHNEHGTTDKPGEGTERATCGPHGTL